MAPACTIGVDLGGTKLLAGAVDEGLNIVASERRIIAGLSREELLSVVASAVGAVSAGRSVGAVGFGIPSLIDAASGVSVYSNHLPLEDFAFRDELGALLGLPVAVDNDANCAVWAEASRGAGAGAGVVVMLTLGTGIGSGVVIDGSVFRGALGAATELGHMVVDAGGPACFGRCKSHGCLEAVASGSALAREAMWLLDAGGSALAAAVRAGEAPTGELVTRLAISGDPPSLGLLTDLGRSLGVGLSNVVNIFNPDVIVLGGGVMAAGDLVRAPAVEEMRARALSPSREHVRVELAAFGAGAGMVGAALLARELVAA